MLLVGNLTLLLLPVARADAAAYYVGGGKGVKLAVRVVDRQIVWSKVAVHEHCYDRRRGYYERTEASADSGPVAPAKSRKLSHFREPIAGRRKVFKPRPRY